MLNVNERASRVGFRARKKRKTLLGRARRFKGSMHNHEKEFE